MDGMIAFLFAVVMGMASGATAATDVSQFVSSDMTTDSVDMIAIATPVAAEKSATRKLLEQVNGDVQAIAGQSAKRERYSVRINTRNDAGERLSIRIFRRARGACSGGRCG